MTAKSLDSQKVWGGGGGAGQSTIPIQVKISCLKMIKTVLTLIYSQLFVVWSAMINIMIFILIKKQH